MNLEYAAYLLNENQFLTEDADGEGRSKAKAWLKKNYPYLSIALIFKVFIFLIDCKFTWLSLPCQTSQDSELKITGWDELDILFDNINQGS